MPKSLAARISAATCRGDYYLDGTIMESDALDIAKPFEARRIALERVLLAAKDYVEGETPGTAWPNLRAAIAAVPEIPEDSS